MLMEKIHVEINAAINVATSADFAKPVVHTRRKF